MTRPVKIVVLGGSGVATPLLAKALADAPGRTQPLELVLVGRSAGKLARVSAVARMLAAGDPLLTVSCESVPEKALEGAVIVLNQVRVGGLEARLYDETFPHQLGIAGEETVGPGGFANAVRTIPVVLESARMIERACPDALLISFTNPASLVQYAVQRSTRLKVLGLCDVPVSMRRQISAAAGADPQQVWLDYIGMHHFGWVVGANENGRDLLQTALENSAAAAPELDPALTRAFGAIPSPYFAYLFHPEKMLARKQATPPRAGELIDLQKDLLAEFERLLKEETPDARRALHALARRSARWYEIIIVPVMLAIIEKQDRSFIINHTNGQSLPWLPEDAVIEAPVQFQDGWYDTLPAPPVPAEVKSLIQANCAYEMLAVEAILERDRAKALRALLLNPIIRSYEKAVKTLELAWG